MHLIPTAKRQPESCFIQNHATGHFVYAYMNGGKTNNNILRLPLSINYKGVDYRGEVIGKSDHAARYFTCHFHNANMFVMEAVHDKFTRSWDWVSKSAHEFDYLVPAIGKELEKYLRR